MRVTVVGSRKAPKEMLTLGRLLGYQLAEDGAIQRSGDAIGMDGAFYQGIRDYCEKRNYVNCQHIAEIYLAWNGAEGFEGKRWDTHPSKHFIDFRKLSCFEKAIQMAGEIHPYWNKCGWGTKQLHGRNMCQVLGRRLDTPSQLEILWAPEDGTSVKGGTRSAYELARKYGIPCINLANEESVEWALSYLGIRRKRWLDLAGV